MKEWGTLQKVNINNIKYVFSFLKFLQYILAFKEKYYYNTILMESEFIIYNIHNIYKYLKK